MTTVKYLVIIGIAALVATSNGTAVSAQSGSDDSSGRGDSYSRHDSNDDKDGDNHRQRGRDVKKAEDNSRQHDGRDDNDGDNHRQRGRDVKKAEDNSRNTNTSNATTTKIAGTSEEKSPGIIPSTGLGALGSVTGLGALTYAASAYLQSRRK